MKKIIVFLIDSFMPEALNEALRQDKIPLFKELIQRGEINPNCVSVFPSMASSFNASFITGAMPGVHKIPGDSWYDRGKNRIVNYGASPTGLLRLGLGRVIEDALYNKNTQHLNPDISTIFEELNLKGYRAASFSYELYRGHNVHPINFPWFLKPFVRKMPRNIGGPDEFVLGRLANSFGNTIKAPHSIFRRLGLNDEFTIQAFIKSIEQNKQADFSLLYLPTSGEAVHKKYLAGGVKSLIRINKLLEKVIHAYGGLEQALKENTFILTGNHSQIKTSKFIHLDFILRNFKYPSLREKISDKHDLVISNNQRMTFLYYQTNARADEIIQELIKEPGIDLIARTSREWINVYQDSMRDFFSFKKGEDYLDEYGQAWDIRGDSDILNLFIIGESIRYRTYPDALNMLASAFASNDSPVIIATAKPTYMFKSEGSVLHKGGASHGGLHYLEMRVPFITSEKTDLALPKRTIDIKDYLVTLLERENCSQ